MFLVTVAFVMAAMTAATSGAVFATVSTDKGNLRGEVSSNATPGEGKSRDCFATSLGEGFGEESSTLAQSPNSGGSVAQVECEGTGGQTPGS